MKHGERKKQILLISLELFAKKGYAETSIREIAAKANIRESAIYNHFESKKEIMKELIDIYKSSSVGVKIFTDDLLDEIANPKNFLKSYTFKLIDYWQEKEDSEFFKIIVTEQAKNVGDFPVSLNHLLDDTKKIWTFIFTELQKNDLIRKFNPSLAADIFVSYLYMIRIEFLMNYEKRNVLLAVTKIDEFIDYFWLTIKAE